LQTFHTLYDIVKEIPKTKTGVKVREHLVECPSGLKVMVREFLVKDEDLLADQKAIKRGIASTKLLSSITTSMEDPGPYDFEDKVDWSKTLLGDRMVVFLFNRVATWGEFMDLRLTCPACGATSEVEVNLEDLEIKPLPESGFNHIKTGDPITVTLPSSGTKVGFRLLVGNDEQRVAKLQKNNQASMSSAYLRYRIVDIDGVSRPTWKSWLQELSARDAAFLRAEFDSHDGGIEHGYDFDCPSCGQDWHDDVKFGSDFLFPTYKKRDAMTG
jgi:hypothetical protein